MTLRNRRRTLIPAYNSSSRGVLRFALPLVQLLAIGVALASGGCAPGAAQSEAEYPEIFRVECVGRVSGCACYTASTGDAAAGPVYHAEAATAVGPDDPALDRRLVRVRNLTCWHPRAKLRAMSYARVPRSPFAERMDHRPVDLARLAPGAPAGEAALAWTDALPRRALGRFFATYYHLADEHLHPGPETDVITPDGGKIGRASEEFLRQVMWQGSGIARNGTRLHYSGITMRFRRYSGDIWGWGAGAGYSVYPYRTFASNFPALCRAAGYPPGCGKSQVIGLLVFIKEVRERRILMPGGEPHDGYFCATDTGSPHYIRSDRIDIFTGLHGGGNPYLPPSRRGNYLIDGGIQNLIPSDWRLWSGPDERVWCDQARIPANPAAPAPGDCVHDFRTVAREKALHLFAVLDPAGRPVKCRPRP